MSKKYWILFLILLILLVILIKLCSERPVLIKTTHCDGYTIRTWKNKDGKTFTTIKK